MSTLRRLLPAGLALCLVGCQSYEPAPLVPADVLPEVEAARDLRGDRNAAAARESGEAPPPASVAPPDALSFSEAARWMHDLSPALREARAELAKARALAGTPTPLTNPELTVGALLGTHLADKAASALQPLLEFGFTIPLSGRLSRQDDVHAARAREAEVRLVVAHRREYLELRRLYAAWVLNHRHERIQQGLLDSAERSLELTRRLVQAGGATALDTGLREIEVAERELEQLEIRARRARLAQALAERIGVHTRHVRRPAPDSDLRPALELPELGRAKEILVANHPELVVLRARYEVAEQELRLEIARQYPDLSLGGSYGGDPGETRKVWGLALGIPLPVFDRNQQSIAIARGERDRIHASYEATLSRALAALEGAYEEHALAVEKRRRIESVILARARSNLEVARKAIEAGAFDSLKSLVVEQTLGAAEIAGVGAEEEVARIHAEIERVLGVPLGQFPGEDAGAFPDVPERIPAPAGAAPPASPTTPEEEERP
ncbi:MAG: TolC family protein [Planctomycetes bacterium]|nr:TolC family protein [Planctomycetota bacterium]